MILKSFYYYICGDPSGLDVHLNDDREKKYEENTAENFAKTKIFLLNLVKAIPPEGKKCSLRSNLK